MQLAPNRSASLPPLKGALQNVFGSSEGGQNSARTPRRSHPDHVGQLPKLPHSSRCVYTQQLPQAPPGKAPQNGRNAARNRRMSGIAANVPEARKAYNSIDPAVAEELDTQVQHLVSRHENLASTEEAKGIYVVLEHCHSCAVHHALTTRHDEAQYAETASNVLNYILDATREVVADAVGMLCQLECAPRSLGCNYALAKEIWHNASRLGACEVYLLTPQPAPETSGGLLHFPPAHARHDDDVSSIDADNKPKTWGAQLGLRGGYVATLLHSKLSSKSWPKEQHIVRRLFESLPLGTVTINVFSSSGLPLSSFTVEVTEVSPAPSRKSQKSPIPSFVGYGHRGVCQIADVPLQTELEVHVSHPSMQTQVLRFTTSNLKMGFVLGTDIAFDLWSLDVPGGLAIYASMEGAHPSRIPDKARPLQGFIEMTNDEQISVQGRMQMPWENFNVRNIQPAMAFSKLRRIFVNGYHPAELEEHAASCTMKSVQQHECIEIAMLPSPEALLRVVMPGTQKPLSDVRLQVESELEHATTNEAGECSMFLRPGAHRVKLMHSFLTPGWVEQQVTISSLAPRIQIPLPISVSVWRAPIRIRGKTRCSEVWAVWGTDNTSAKNWEPYVGRLQGGYGNILDVADGVAEVERCPATVMQDITSPDTRSIAVDPITKLTLVPPFLKRIVPNSSNTMDKEPWLCGPHLLGCYVDEAPLAPLGYQCALAMRAMTCCCGAGVAGVKISVDRGRYTDSSGLDGTCTFAEFPPGEQTVSVAHRALPRGCVNYNALKSTDSDTPLELATVFPTEIYLYSVDMPGNRQCLYAAASKAEIPSDAAAFCGRVVIGGGRELKPEAFDDRNIPLYVIPSADTLPEMPCPLKAFQILPDAPDLDWCPQEQMPLTHGSCGLQELLNDGPKMMGFLKRPSVSVRTHACDNRKPLTVDNDGCVGDVCQILSTKLNMPLDSFVIFQNERMLSSSDIITARSALDLWPLGSLEVTVRTACCFTGLPDVAVFLRQPYLRDGRRKEEDVSGNGERLGFTGNDGRCCVTTNCGEHFASLQHPFFYCCATAPTNMKVTVGQGCPQTIEYTAETLFYIYAAYASSSAERDSSCQQMNVWLCGQAEELPKDAIHVVGSLHAPGTEEPIPINTSASNFSPVRIPNKSGTSCSHPDTQCPLKSLEFRIDEGEVFLWCPEKHPSFASSCGHASLLKGRILAGILKPAVLLQSSLENCPVRLPADMFGTIGLIREHLEQALDMPADEIGIFAESGSKDLGDTVLVLSGQTLQIHPLGKLALRAQVPEGEDMPEALEGVRITIDGEEFGETDEFGECELTVRAGSVDVALHHACFDGGQRLLSGIEILQGELHERTVLCDIRLFFYATNPDPSEDDEEPEILPTLVWVCAHREHIPQEAFGVRGMIESDFIHGCTASMQIAPTRTASMKLGPGASMKIAPGVGNSVGEIVLLSGSTAEESTTSSDSLPQSVILSALRLEVEDEELLWRPKDPSPLEERTNELGGSEYLRLLECPVVLGYLDPILTIRFADNMSAPLKLPAPSHRNVQDVKDSVAKSMTVSADDLEVFEGITSLANDAAISLGMDLRIVEFAQICVKVVTGCCADSFPDVHVDLGDESKGFTDVQGNCSFKAAVGTHAVRLRFGTDDVSKSYVSHEVVVRRAQANHFVIPADVCVFIYATDPDLDEDEADAVEDDVPTYDPSCVWLAGDFNHVPEDARPLTGSVNCEGVTVSLNSNCIELSRLKFGSEPGPEAPETCACKIGNLLVDCSRKGFCWRSKDPSPLSERLGELGGCELLRLMACPVALGFLKPAASIYFPDTTLAAGSLSLPLEECGAIDALREQLQEQVGEDGLTLAVASKDPQPLDGTFLTGPTDILCARKGESLSAARDAYFRYACG